MKRFVSLFTLICVALLLAVAGAHAQAGKFSVVFDDTPLSRVLDTFKRFDPNFQFALAPDLADTKITVSLDGVTVDEALQVVLGPAGLMSVKDAGIYQIRPKPEAKGARPDRPALRLPPPLFINRPATPGASADAAAGAAPAAGAGAAAGAEKENPPLRMILMRFEDPSLFGEPFGGSAGGSSGGNSSGGGSSYGGNSGGNSGSSRGSGGSSRGSSGSSRGNSGNSGNSGSSRGSSRGSSGGNY